MPTIIELQGKLNEAFLAEWERMILEADKEAGIANANSIQAAIDELVRQYGAVPSYIAKDLTKDPNCILGPVLDSFESRPNNKQFACAQYSIGSLYKHQR